VASLSSVFGRSVRVKVLECLLGNPGRLYSQSEISRQVGCSVSSVGRATDALQRLDLVKVVYLPGQAKVIALNPESSITTILLKLREDLKSQP
jgi:DNA-binding transcriptional regulator GbsR (MarR family)